MHIMHLDLSSASMSVTRSAPTPSTHPQRQETVIVDSPVIRIFGCLDHSERVTVVCHIHQVFPYFYFRPENVLDTTFASLEQVRTYLPSFHQKLEASLKSSGKQNVMRLEAVLRKSMYGYFRNDLVFVKVFMYKPQKIKHLVTGLEVIDTLAYTPMCICDMDLNQVEWGNSGRTNEHV